MIFDIAAVTGRTGRHLRLKSRPQFVMPRALETLPAHWPRPLTRSVTQLTFRRLRRRYVAAPGLVFNPAAVKGSREPFNGVEASNAPSPQNTPFVSEFSQWFGASEVVDKYGKPLVVYHGTALDPSDDISEFKGTRATERTYSGSTR